MMATRSDRLRQLAGVVTFALVVALNGVAGSGGLSGESIGEIANRHPSAFLPASYVFGIWGLIYLALLVFTVDQALPSRADAAAPRRVGWLWPVNGALNVGWIVAFSYGRFVLAMAVMLGLLANLIAIHLRLGEPDRLETRDRWTVALPFGLYLSWISVAVIANTFQLAAVYEWSGLGVDETVWSAAVMVVAMGLASFMAVRRGVLVFPLVLAWALVGIAVRYPSTPLLTVPAWTLTGLAAIIVAVAYRTRNRGAAA